MFFLFVLFVSILKESDGARILAVYPSPSISHQVVFRPLTLELIKRGHHVVVITTDPIYTKGQAPVNLTEIDFHERSYKLLNKKLNESISKGNDICSRGAKQNRVVYETLTEIMLDQVTSIEMQNIIKDTNSKFDLLLLEAIINPLVALTHVFKVPTVLVSSFIATSIHMKTVGAPTHSFLYPTISYHKVFNLTFWEKIQRLYEDYFTLETLKEIDEKAAAKLKDILGYTMPSLRELRNNVDMLFLNLHPIWALNRPVPPNVIYVGGLHQNPPKSLSQDLKHHLDSSENGIIYISFGTNDNPAFLPARKVQAIVNVLSKLPYDVLWKWNHDELPGRAGNIRISKWWPQSDLLRHPKIKLFITQGGLQSTDEAITAGVPVLGVPLQGDQWYNVEQYVYHGIGVRCDMDSITEDSFERAVNEVLNNESYRKNMLHLRSIMRDQPQAPLDRAMWWLEYVIRHGGAKHFRSPSANITWAEYLELDFVFRLLALFVSSLAILSFVVYKLFKFIYSCVYSCVKPNVKLKIK